MSDIRATIMTRRLALCMTQAELAKRTGIARPNISRFESGRHDPQLSTLQKLCTALGLELGAHVI